MDQLMTLLLEGTGYQFNSLIIAQRSTTHVICEGLHIRAEIAREDLLVEEHQQFFMRQ